MNWKTSDQDPTLRHAVSYADTDAGGVVYHARYLEMAERARNKLMKLAGFTFSMLAEQYQVMLIMHKVGAIYHAPAMLDDELTLKTRLTTCQPSRTVWVTDIARDEALLASVTIQIVAMHISTRKLTRHPDAFLERLMPYLGAAPVPGHRRVIG